MPFIPVSFVVSLLLVILFVVVIRNGDDRHARNWPFLTLILLSAFQAFLSGLRWGYEIHAVMFVSPVTAAMVPPLVYCGVARLVGKNGSSADWTLVLHAIPTAMIVIVLLVGTWRDMIDVLLPAIFILYALAILYLMWPGPDALRRTPFESAAPTYRSVIFAASALLLSASLDLFVYADIVWTRGEYAPGLVAIGNLIALAILSVASAVAGKAGDPAEPDAKPDQVDDQGDKETLAAIQSLLETRYLYRDPDLNLDRLARRSLIPARQISTAINRATGKNVSQYVNEFRIAEACQLLAETSKPVTEIMFDVGFQTKSNFNREFRRITDVTPVQFRQAQPKPD